MKPATILVLLGGVAVAALVCVHAMHRQTINHFAILEDPSISYTGGCESSVGSAEEVLHAPTLNPHSTLMLLVLGDGTSAYEPREMGRYDAPVSHKVIEGRHATERRRLEVLNDIWTKCKSVQPTSISPIFMGVKEAVAVLRAAGCREGSHCELRVNSDLEENVEAGIKNRLNSTRGQKPLPAALDNAGIDVTFCGYAATAGRIVDPTGREVRKLTRRDPEREDRIQQVWLAMFTNPERVKFEPYCPKPSNPELYTQAGLLPKQNKRQ